MIRTKTTSKSVINGSYFNFVHMRLTASLFLIMFSSQFLNAQKTTIEKTGDVLQLALPVSAIASTLIWKDNTQPVKQVLLTMGLSLVVTQSIKVIINKERPLGGSKAFPSGHTSSAFTGAAFLERRYGWKVGIPSYAIASYVAWTRIDAQKHDYWDLFGGAIVGIGSAYMFTKPYHGKNVSLSRTYDGNYLINYTVQF